MIAFDSPEGATLRQLNPSRSALVAVWLAAVDQGQDSWVAWSGEALADHLNGAEAVALQYVQAIRADDSRRARQLWAVLASFPAAARNGRIAEVAHRLQASVPA